MLAASAAAARELTAKAQHLEGAMRNRFMSACLNGDGHARAPTPRQRVHEQCNERARGFMTQCEKGEAAVEAASEREQEKNCARRADGRRLAGDDRREYLKGCLDGAAEASR